MADSNGAGEDGTHQRLSLAVAASVATIVAAIATVLSLFLSLLGKNDRFIYLCIGIAALAGGYGGWKAAERKWPGLPRRRSLTALAGVVLLIVLGVGALLIGIRFGPKSVTITAPVDGQPIQLEIQSSGSGRFLVQGHSVHVASDGSLEIYLLLRPLQTTVWYVQGTAAEIKPDGTWTAYGYYGSQDHPPVVQDQVYVQAIVVKRGEMTNRDQVNDPLDISAEARSEPVRIVVDSLKRGP